MKPEHIKALKEHVEHLKKLSHLLLDITEEPLEDYIITDISDILADLVIIKDTLRKIIAREEADEYFVKLEPDGGEPEGQENTTELATSENCPRCGTPLKLMVSYYDIPGRDPPLLKQIWLECPRCGYKAPLWGHSACNGGRPEKLTHRWLLFNYLYDKYEMQPDDTLEEAMEIVKIVERLVRENRIDPKPPYQPRTFRTCYNLLYTIYDLLDVAEVIEEEG